MDARWGNWNHKGYEGPPIWFTCYFNVDLEHKDQLHYCFEFNDRLVEHNTLPAAIKLFVKFVQDRKAGRC